MSKRATQIAKAREDVKDIENEGMTDTSGGARGDLESGALNGESKPNGESNPNGGLNGSNGANSNGNVNIVW